MSIYKPSAQSLLSDMYLTRVGAISALCNGASRIIFGALQDRYGFKKVYGCLITIQLIDCFIIYNARAHAIRYLICVAYAFIMQGAIITCLPATVVQLFGMKSGPKLASLMSISEGVSGLSSSLLL